LERKRDNKTTNSKSGNRKIFKNLIYALSETELQIKKNINNSINLITDFILFQSSSAANN
jgi:DNA polymerase-3 subunit delta